MVQKSLLYDVHLKKFQQTAFIRNREEYEALYRRSLDDPEGFWAKQAEFYLAWDRKWDFVYRADLSEARFEWFGGGMLNASYNCLDRHLPQLENKIAYYWEGDDPGQSSSITYKDLFRRVNKLAAILRSKGVKKGDRVVIYLPMTIEMPIALLACARIGAVHNVVFGRLSADAVCRRIRDCEARVVITADGRYREGKCYILKNNLDEALEQCTEVETVIVCKHCGMPLELNSVRDIWWHEAEADPKLPDTIAPVPMDAEDPLFIIHTSGSSGEPKGVVHTHAGYLLSAAMTTKLVFDLKPDETFWCTANIEWITGHTYGVYGPLLNGLTSVLFEGSPGYPDFDRYWRIVEKYRVDKFYTTPTTIRSLAKAGDAHIRKYDISSIKLLGSVGEPISPEVWRWYFHNVGRDEAPIMDTWWQTETGAAMITPLPGVFPLKAGSCGFPFFGVEPIILDPDTGREAIYPNQEGLLFIKRPWPGIARTFYNNHYKYQETYFPSAPGLYFTGDGAKRDEEGYYWITGRLDDVITISNFRLGTAEIESAIVLHEKVAEAAVVGLPHPKKGQGIHAFVTLNTGASRTEELKKELVDLVRSEIGPIATIDVVQWADSLPKTLSGKIMHRVLQKIAKGEVDYLGDTSMIADISVVEDLVRDRMNLEKK